MLRNLFFAVTNS